MADEYTTIISKILWSCSAGMPPRQTFYFQNFIHVLFQYIVNDNFTFGMSASCIIHLIFLVLFLNKVD